MVQQVACPRDLEILRKRGQRLSLRKSNEAAGAVINETPALNPLSGAAKSAWISNALSTTRLRTGTDWLAVEAPEQHLLQ